MLAAHQPLPRPGLAWGPYPQRRLPAQGSAGAATAVRAARIGVAHLARLAAPWHRLRLQAFAKRVATHAKNLADRDDMALARLTAAMRLATAQRRVAPHVLVDLFALMSITSQATLGVTPWPSQLIAARIMLGDRLAEMGTGEGKTLAIGMAAAAAALSGVPVHVLTANDYLVERDRATLAPFFEALGLTHGSIVGASDRDTRLLAYGCDITYVTAREIAFDYLKDRLNTDLADTEADWRVRALSARATPGQSNLLRGLCMAIIDEADSQLLDDAVTPLILARKVDDDRATARCREIWHFAGSLWMTRDFIAQPARRRAELTEGGVAQAKTLTGHGLHVEELIALVETALSARHMMQRDRDYLVDDEGVTPIDEPTGRIAHGRQWSRGLHQMIEIKEGLAPSALQNTAARINFQTLFSRYVRLAGMSGTLRDARSELAAIYRVNVWPVAERTINRRLVRPPRVFATSARKSQAAIEIARAAADSRRPVLLTAESVGDAMTLSERLSCVGLAHRVLHAGQSDDEADVLRLAGFAGSVTVATNIAGRGADILLDDEARERGGLLVLVCHTNSERRLDRQLFGRCARAGEPGEVLRLSALTDDTLRRHLPAWVLTLAVRCTDRHGCLPRTLGPPLLRFAQSLAQARHHEDFDENARNQL